VAGEEHAPRGGRGERESKALVADARVGMTKRDVLQRLYALQLEKDGRTSAIGPHAGLHPRRGMRGAIPHKWGCAPSGGQAQVPSPLEQRDSAEDSPNCVAVNDASASPLNSDAERAGRRPGFLIFATVRADLYMRQCLVAAFALACARKKRIISRLASGPRASV
jgi:hypothetical protein